MIKKLPSQKYLKECLRYEPETGKLYWKRRPRKHFESSKKFKTWNAHWSGAEAFTACQKAPGGIVYKVGKLNNCQYKAHRVVWKLVTGKEPPAIIDHKDKKGSNNRFANMRDASPSQNAVNRKNKVAGVYHLPYRRKPWQPRLHLNKKLVYLGWFVSKKKAVAARRAAEFKYYGAFAP